MIPTWRARGAQPAVGDLAGGGQLGAENRGEGAQLFVFVRSHARADPDDDVGSRQCLDIVVAALADHTDTTTGSDRARFDHEVAPVGGCRRKDARADRGHLRGALASDVGHERAGECRFGGDETILSHRECDGIANEPGPRGRGCPSGHLTAEGRAGCEEGPGGRVHEVGHHRVADVLGDSGSVQGDDEVGAGAGERVPRRFPGGASACTAAPIT